MTRSEFFVVAAVEDSNFFNSIVFRKLCVNNFQPFMQLGIHLRKAFVFVQDLRIPFPEHLIQIVLVKLEDRSPAAPPSVPALRSPAQTIWY